MGDAKLGEILFLVGVLLALVVGLLQGSFEVVKNNAAGIYGVLALLGLLVGLMNISPNEAQGFLIASIALLSLGNVSTTLGYLFNGPLAAVEPYINGFLGAIAVFVAPAALVVALVSVYQMASGEEEGMMNEMQMPPGMKAVGMGKKK